MRHNVLHSWSVSPAEAVHLQGKLVRRLEAGGALKDVRHVAGADVSLDPVRNLGFAGVIVYSFPELAPVERQWASLPLTFPYVPGLLTFREGPVLLEAFAKVKTEPDVIFFDGQGIAHPRGIGIASHMGLLLDKPTVGCGKSRLVGNYREPGAGGGQWSPLLFKGRRVGAVLRTRENCRPVFISPGHRVDFDAALDLVLKCMDGRRIPKPTREADKFVAELKRKH